jgi:hypothetical protein
VRSISDNVLHLATTTIAPMEKVLWPFLLETLIPAQYSEGLAVISKCIFYLANKKREEEASDYIIDFDKAGIFLFPLFLFFITHLLNFLSLSLSIAVNLPKPPAIIARYLVDDELFFFLKHSH